MKILEGMAQGGFEQVVALNDASCGLSGFLVIHDTTRGPAAGGIRIYSYPTEDDALADDFRLASAMTFKGAAAGLPVGGGKIVLRESPDMNREEVLRAVGRFIQGQGGRFLAGRDVGVPVPHGAWVRSETRFMVDESENGVGDLNRSTAIGVGVWRTSGIEFSARVRSLERCTSCDSRRGRRGKLASEDPGRTGSRALDIGYPTGSSRNLVVGSSFSRSRSRRDLRCLGRLVLPLRSG